MKAIVYQLSGNIVLEMSQGEKSRVYMFPDKEVNLKDINKKLKQWSAGS